MLLLRVNMCKSKRVLVRLVLGLLEPLGHCCASCWRITYRLEVLVISTQSYSLISHSDILVGVRMNSLCDNEIVLHVHDGGHSVGAEG